MEGGGHAYQVDGELLQLPQSDFHVAYYLTLSTLF
jgi:hypothetical protein